jgi:hypothetical protein
MVPALCCGKEALAGLYRVAGVSKGTHVFSSFTLEDSLLRWVEYPHMGFDR